MHRYFRSFMCVIAVFMREPFPKTVKNVPVFFINILRGQLTVYRLPIDSPFTSRLHHHSCMYDPITRIKLNSPSDQQFLSFQKRDQKLCVFLKVDDIS